MNLDIKRIHAFDFIRSLAALWGVAFHAGFSYMSSDPSPWLIIDPVVGSQEIDLSIWISHRLRMPLFFLMSGYFSCLVMERKGINYFFTNRVKKILVPFIISSLIILPLVVFLFEAKVIESSFFNTPLQNPYTERIFSMLQMAHLWFLYVLFIFSILAIGLKKLNFFTTILNFLNKFPKLSKVIILLGLFLMHYFMDHMLKINLVSSLKLDPLGFLFYFSFYSWGYLLRNNQQLKNLTERSISRYVALSLSSCLITAGFIFAYQSNSYTQFNEYFYFLIPLGTTIYCYSTLTSMLNLGIRFIRKGSAFINYLSDSSYFIYIVHIPVVILMQRAFYFTELGAISKWILVSVLSYIALFLIYHIIVRFSFIGTYLHGKRSLTT